LKKIIDVNAKDKNGLTALSIALKENNLESALLLKRSGALPENLLEEVLILDLESIKKFIDSKVDLEIRDSSGNTPIILDCLNRNYEIASYLLKNNSNVNARNNFGLTPALIAAMQNDTEILSLLLHYKPDVFPETPTD
jgi:ankyrin repeat protein